MVLIGLLRTDLEMAREPTFEQLMPAAQILGEYGVATRYPIEGDVAISRTVQAKTGYMAPWRISAYDHKVASQ